MILIGAGFREPDAEVARAIELAEVNGIPVIALVGNDAGWTQIAREQVKMLHDYTTEEWDFLMRVNLTSCFWAMKYAFPLLRRRGGGSRRRRSRR